MNVSGEPLVAEATGETVGEAKWNALRELERRAPGIDKTSVAFEVVSEGERGLLGVGYVPARVVARVNPSAVSVREQLATPAAESLGAEVQDLLQRVVLELGIDCRVELQEDDVSITASVLGHDLGLLIGRRGQTIDAVQYLANAIAYRRYGDERKEVVIDAAGYRERRRVTLESMAVRSAERARSAGEAVELEPMSPVERRIVHLRLKEFPGVTTRSEGDEPARYVIIEPV